MTAPRLSLPVDATTGSESTTLTVEQAEALAQRTLDAIPYAMQAHYAHRIADRERVASDLTGLREHGPDEDEACYCASHPDVNGQAMCKRSNCEDARRYSAGLLRTAALYGVTP